MLGRVGLRGNKAKQLVCTLSGGQKIRLLFASMLSQRPHMLVLDEPTNHLDVESVQALEEAIEAFKGAVVCVSHHRDFIISFARQVWIVGEGAVKVHHAEDELDVSNIIARYAESLGDELDEL